MPAEGSPYGCRLASTSKCLCVESGMNVGAVGYEGFQTGIIHQSRDAFFGTSDVDRISVSIISNAPGLVGRPPPQTAPGALFIERLCCSLDGSFEEVHFPLGVQEPVAVVWY